MRYKQTLIATILLISMVACNNNKNIETNKKETYSGHKVTVLQVINGKTYTYLQIAENDNEQWAAISKRDTKVGEILYYNDALEMKNFKSKELNKTFDSILFISKVSETPITQVAATTGGNMNKKKEISKKELSIKQANGSISIAELYANLDKYKGKTIIVKGKVTKFNSMIMNRNWLHIQDGTGDNNNFDLTITTDETVSVGDVVTFKGTIAVDKDFGAGYYYKVIMETATIVKADII